MSCSLVPIGLGLFGLLFAEYVWFVLVKLKAHFAQGETKAMMLLLSEQEPASEIMPTSIRSPCINQ